MVIQPWLNPVGAGRLLAGAGTEVRGLPRWRGELAGLCAVWSGLGAVLTRLTGLGAVVAGLSGLGAELPWLSGGVVPLLPELGAVAGGLLNATVLSLLVGLLGGLRLCWPGALGLPPLRLLAIRGLGGLPGLPAPRVM